MITSLIALLRPKQWVKNFFVFVPLFFGGSLLNEVDVLNALWTFIAFSLSASSIYCMNDIIDLEDDRRHPVKCHRPIASGRVPVRRAWFFMALCAVLPYVLLMPLTKGRWETMAVILFYWLLNVAYCLKLKQFAILDVCVVASGFVLRILAGGSATDIVPSNWLVLMSYLLCLFLSFAKRRDDVVRMEQTGEAPRQNTSRYNLTFINQAVTISASVTLVCYIMYTVSPEVTARFHSQHLYLTTLFVILGLLRYIQLAVVDRQSGDPTKVVLRDRPMQAIVLGWIVTFLVIIYL